MAANQAFVVRKNQAQDSQYPYQVVLETVKEDEGKKKSSDEVIVHINASALNHR